MSPNPTRLLVPLALAALILLSPTLASAHPQVSTLHPAAESTEPSPGLFSRLWDVLFAIWTTGSGLDPNGTGAPSDIQPSAGGNDTGSGLDPNG